jgi:hypothetical protein
MKAVARSIPARRRSLTRRAFVRAAAILYVAPLLAPAKAADRSRQTMIPRALLEGTTLVDVAGISSGPTPYLLTVEHGAEWHRPGPDLPPMEPAMARIWSVPSAAPAAVEAGRQIGELPFGFALAAAVLGDRLAALVEANETAPAWLTLAPWKAPALGAFAAPTELAVDPALATTISLPAKHTWSTTGLPPEGWMFHPSVTADAAADRFILAMNTADAQAVVWHWSAAAGGVPERRAAAAAALDPVVAVAGGRHVLLFRRPPPDWGVFFGDMRYAGGGYPLAMPLMMGELDADGSLRNVLDLSAARGIGDVFAFAAHGDQAGITIAAATGTRTEALLRLLTVDLAGEARSAPAEAPLRSAPLRIALAVAGSTTLVGVVYRSQGRSVAEALIHQR